MSSVQHSNSDLRVPKFFWVFMLFWVHRFPWTLFCVFICVALQSSSPLGKEGFSNLRGRTGPAYWSLLHGSARSSPRQTQRKSSVGCLRTSCNMHTWESDWMCGPARWGRRRSTSTGWSGWGSHWRTGYWSKKCHLPLADKCCKDIS